MTENANTNPLLPPSPPFPRVTIKFCTQCKWLLRAAYYAQELLSTFSTSLGEVALQPATGGAFVVEIVSGPAATGSAQGEGRGTTSRVLWDRKVDGGFPETKELKRRVRDVIDPGRNLGHVDRNYGKNKGETQDHHGETRSGSGSGSGSAGATQNSSLATEKATEGGYTSGTCNVKGDKCEDCE